MNYNFLSKSCLPKESLHKLNEILNNIYVMFKLQISYYNFSIILHKKSYQIFFHVTTCLRLVIITLAHDHRSPAKDRSSIVNSQVLTELLASFFFKLFKKKKKKKRSFCLATRHRISPPRYASFFDSLSIQIFKEIPTLSN